MKLFFNVIHKRKTRAMNEPNKQTSNESVDCKAMKRNNETNEWYETGKKNSLTHFTTHRNKTYRYLKMAWLIHTHTRTHIFYI
jgi:uncharacterized protein YxeA